MEVFLIPVGADRYELYCEVPDLDDTGAEEAPTGYLRGILHRFRGAIADAERERHRPAPLPGDDDEQPSWYERTRRKVMCRIAEAIAEQRLLWHIRGQDAAVAVHPGDIAASRALEIVRVSMQADYEKHRFWLIVDAVTFLVSGVLVILPGPNLIGYYFGFRMVGHFLSMRGARRALDRVAWSASATDLLVELRATMDLEPDEREARVHDIAAKLQLERLARFFLRTAVPSA
jgi:hypothetical protein